MRNDSETTRGAEGRARAGRFGARVAVAGGLVAVGAAFGALLSLPGERSARAGDQNYVKSSSHEAVSRVRLDEDITIVFNSPLFAPSVGPDTILIRTGATGGEQANGQFVIGKFLYDRRRFRRAVIRPEAIQEYYQLVRGNPREVATRLAQQTIRGIERSGRLSSLARIDRALSTYFGPTYGAGTRLDDDAVVANYPPLLEPGDPLQAYRTSVAGDDFKWTEYLRTVAKVEKSQVVTPDELARAQQDIADLTSNPEYERFYHPVDPATGIASDRSVLRGREYRKVLFDRRQANRVTFVPEVPIRPDLSDTGFKTGSAYSLLVPASQPGVFNTVLTRQGLRPLLQRDGRDYSTYFTTILGSISSTELFLDNDARTATASPPNQKPRIINSTPPNGDSFVDQTTDWEDPDNAFAVTESARKVFSVRIRFAQPLDPRTARNINVTMRKTRTAIGLPGERPVDEVKAIGVFLNQHRLGIVELEVTPSEKLDGDSEYEVAVKGQVKSLGGQVLNTDRKISFSTRSGQPPLDAIREDFKDTINQANPLNPDNPGDVSSAFWSAPDYLDPTRTGRSMGKFIPFVGTGLGAPPDPTIPGDDSPKVVDLVLQAGQTITYATEDLDPASSNFNRQVEYNYNSVDIDKGRVTTIGRFPLVIRCRRFFRAFGASILVNGSDGTRGTMNLDTVNGPPTGGIGGDPGPGGYRGGDGAGAPLTDSLSGQPIVDGQGRLQFDQNKVNGRDGSPGYQLNFVQLGGGSGGYSGDNEAVVTQDWDMNGSFPNDPGDFPLEPLRYREAGGGGGHATPGGNGEGTGGSRETHPVEGYRGGLGGAAYGDDAFSTAPLNFLGIPTLDYGFGGAGGGGGGMEDDAPLDVVGPEDAGGGGGGGGGGAIQICAREFITIDSTLIDASGGSGGATRNALDTTEGQGAAGGCGAGGSIWLQAFEGQVTIQNGAQVTAAGGDNAGSVGEITTSSALAPNGTPIPIKGKGGAGGDGYVRLEDVDGLFANLAEQVVGVLATARFAPEADGSFPGRDDDVPMVINSSVVYSRWFNSRLDTPFFEPAYDDPATPTIIEGTAFNAYEVESGGQVLIEVRSAPDDVANTGHPNRFQITPWVALDQADTIGNRRYLQFRITYTLPFNFLFTQPYPYVDYFQVNVELK